MSHTNPAASRAVTMSIKAIKLEQKAGWAHEAKGKTGEADKVEADKVEADKVEADKGEADKGKGKDEL
jgi:hypothetical protein